MKRVMKRVIAALLLCVASAGALAHRFHTGITEISHNEATGNVEIVHTLMAHDVDALLAARHKRTVDLSDSDDEALLRAYIDERFYLLGRDSRRLPLKWVGLTANVESVVIYQELEKAPLDKVARVHNDILVDFLPRQSNTLNIKRGKDIRSLSFDRKNSERPLK